MIRRKYVHTNRICLVDFPLRNIISYYPEDVFNIITDVTPTLGQRILKRVPIIRRFVKEERVGWPNECKDYDTIILFDQRKNYSYYAKKIEEHVEKNTRLILYLMNPVFYSEDYKCISSRWEIWSFSETDSKQMGFKYGETFYSTVITRPFKDVVLSKDVFFIGTEKGRKDTIRRVEKELLNQGLITDIRIVDNLKALYRISYSKYLPYKENCAEVAGSKALLEIVQSGQTGLTLRTMEALFFHKKLITNNLYIKDSPLYNANNIFIIDEDDVNQLPVFINSPIQPIEDSLVSEFSFESWLERLVNNKEFGYK